MSQAGEKTEKATDKKRKDARKDGQVLKSTELTTAFCAIVMLAFMYITWSSFTDKLIVVFQDYLSPGVLMTGNGQELTMSSIKGLFAGLVLKFIPIVLPVFGVAMLAGLLINVLQIGFMFTTKPLAPKLNRISPISGFKRIFSSRTVIELLKSMLKVGLLGYMLYTEYMKILDHFDGYMGINIYTAFIEIVRTALMIAIKMCMVLALIAGFDFLYQWRKREKDLMMTKQEVKDEYRNTEGDPQIKSKIRQKQRQMSTMRMMESVPTADVVITNPTHLAIALRYEQGVDSAPKVVAMGQDFVAQKIKEKAREHGVEIIEDKPLAQALFKVCEIDREIPEEFYKAVADILVYVMRRKNSTLRSI